MKENKHGNLNKMNLSDNYRVLKILIWNGLQRMVLVVENGHFFFKSDVWIHF